MAESSPASGLRRHRRGITRSVAACQRCRKRKQRCDGKLPACGPCDAADATCIMSDRLIAQQNRNCECDSLRAQLSAAEQRGNELAQKCQQLESQLILALENVRPESSGAGPLSAQMVQPTRLDANPDHRFTSRILRPTFSRPFSNEVNRSAMSSAWELWGDDNDIEVPSTHGENLNSNAYLNLVDAFFDRRWPYLPVLNRQTFLSNHLTPFLNASDIKPISKFLVNIVCAIAATEKSSNISDKGHRLFFNTAARDLDKVMSSDNFECIQCLLLLCMYGHNEPQSVNMWYTTGLALNLALGIDLHRKESLSNQDTLNAEMSKRVFWCVYVMNCSMAINMGRPLGIQESDISMPLPLQLTDAQLNESIQSPLSQVSETLIPHVADTSTFIHIIKLRQINAAVYKTFHSVGSTLVSQPNLDNFRTGFLTELNQWLITAPRYIQTLSTFQSTEWFQIAFHHAVLSLYRPSRAIPMPLPDDLRVCTESAIGLISSYSALYARNRIKYTFVAIHSLFMAAVTMLYSLRAFAPLRRELTKPVVQTNISTFLTLIRGICDGRPVGEKCCGIIERLGHSILALFESEDQENSDSASSTIDREFQTWFGLQTHAFPTPSQSSEVGFNLDGYASGSRPESALHPQLPDIQADLPWADLFTEGIDMGTTDVWSVLF